MLEASEDDVEWKDYKFNVKGVPGKSVTMKEVAFAAYTNPAPDTEPGLEATYYYDPPNLTFPNGAYIAVVDVDNDTGTVKVRRFLAVDDCGMVINPMIVEGQIHGGLTEGFAIAFMQEIKYDDGGNNLNTNFTEYLVPTALETPHWETDSTVTPSPHHPIGAKGVGESPERRVAGSVRQRRDRCALAARRHAHRHAADARKGLERDPRSAKPRREPRMERAGKDPGEQGDSLGVHQRSGEDRLVPARRPVRRTSKTRTTSMQPSRSRSVRCAATSSSRSRSSRRADGNHMDLKITGGGFGSVVDLLAGADLNENGCNDDARLERQRAGPRPGRNRRRPRARRAGARVIATTFENVKNAVPKAG